MSDEAKVGDKKRQDLAREVEELRIMLSKLVDFEKEEKLQLAKKLQESEERFKDIFEQHYDAIFLLEPEHLTCLDTNLMAESLFGFSRSELTADFTRIFKNKTEFEDFKRFVSAHPGKEFLISQFAFVTKEREEIICGVKGKLIKIHDRDVLYSSFRDIREKIETAEKEKRLQAKLIQTNKMTSLGTLASGIAHEINNPNNFIMTNSQMFADIWSDTEKILESYYSEHGDFILGGLPFADLKEVVPGLVNGIIEGSRRISNIIKSLKEFSRPVDNRLQEKIDINKAINFSISILESQVKKYTDCLTIEVGHHIPQVLGNPQQIEQVLINLVQNALQALPDKSRKVTVSSSFDEKGGVVIIKIIDEGIGISKEVVERITEPFFTTKKKTGGTGLGLYISYSIIKKHGGTLDIQSQPDKGTEVTIKLPVPGREKTDMEEGEKNDKPKYRQ